VASRSLKRHERSMTFVQVADFRLQAEGSQEPPAPYAEDQLLPQSVVPTPSVEFTGNAAIRRDIRRVVRVQEIQFRPAYLHFPGANPEIGARKVN